MTVDASLSPIHLIRFECHVWHFNRTLPLFFFSLSLKASFFKAILVLQQNWEESTYFLHFPCSYSPSLPSLFISLSYPPSRHLQDARTSKEILDSFSKPLNDRFCSPSLSTLNSQPLDKKMFWSSRYFFLIINITNILHVLINLHYY